MPKMLRILLTAVASNSIAGAAATVPSVSELKSDIILLTDNDLYGYHSARRTGAVLLTGASTYSQANTSCRALTETLHTQPIDSGLNSSLSYQQYLGLFGSDQLFWVGSKPSGSCTGIDLQGKIHDLSCQRRLPALCTQSAPIATSDFADNSPAYQIRHNVGNGAFTGFRSFHSWHFRGIPFAPTPARFDYSKPLQPSGSSSALNYGADCLQTPGLGREDCLFLNIWTPLLPSLGSKSRKPKAVVFWIYGGGFNQGSGSTPVNQGVNIASRGDVVFVSFNYRLGNLGFLPLNDGVHNGNYWLSDCISALEWVQSYISAFGGDPSRVTLVGQSAGAAAVRALLASPEAKGLFSGAIMESGPAGFSLNNWYSNYTDVATAYQSVTQAVLNQTGCAGQDELRCLRSLNGTVLATLPTYANYPLLDGKYLTSRGLSLDDSSYVAKVPVLNGVNRDELALITPYISGWNFSDYLSWLKTDNLLDYTSLINNPAFVPSTSGNASLDAANATQRILTDGGLKCLDQATAYSAVQHHVFSAVYQYEFNRTMQPKDANPTGLCPYSIANPHQEEYFKCHGGEILYTLGNIAFAGMPDRDGFDTPFAQVILDYWAAFARTGKPEPEPGFLAARGFWQSAQQMKRAGKWKMVGADAGKSVMRLQWGEGMTMATFADEAQCKALNFPLDYYESVDFSA